MQVIANWNRAGARRPVLDEAPVYYPTEEVPFVFANLCHVLSSSVALLNSPYGMLSVWIRNLKTL